MRLPKMFPILTPTLESKNAVLPINETATIIFTCNAAKVTPTANASILVAMAAGIITVGAIDAEFVSEFSFRVSLNIFSPINTRLKTVEKADQILVLDKGKIVQKGTHQELAGKPGLYADFLNARREAAGWKLT